MPVHALRLIPAQSQDEAFLQVLHASTRAEELRSWGWNEAQSEAFVAQQFLAQQMSYRHRFGAGHDQIIHLDGAAVGRLFVAPVDNGLCLVDIALLAQYRGRGIGTQLLRQVQQTAAARQLPVRLSVLRTNPAQHLYARMGFDRLAQDELCLELVWSPVSDSAIDTTLAAAQALATPSPTGNCHAMH